MGREIIAGSVDEHLLLYDDGQREKAFHCENCGAEIKIYLPIKMSLLVELAESFIRQHFNCKKLEPVTSEDNPTDEH